MKTVYVLGSSMDLLKLDKQFFEENVTVGVNHAYLRAKQLGTNLKYWVGLDQVMVLFDWIASPEATKTVKFVPTDYLCDPRFHDLYQSKSKAGAKDLVIYNRLPFNSYVSVIIPDKLEGVGLDVNGFTITTAMSLAKGLGAERIVLRGVNLTGPRFFEPDHNPDRARYFGWVRKAIYEYSFAIKNQFGIDVVNESK